MTPAQTRRQGIGAPSLETVGVLVQSRSSVDSSRSRFATMGRGIRKRNRIIVVSQLPPMYAREAVAS
jgi:hypothetical protein